jgi:multidrug efflux system membrane fusion protein
MIRSVLAHRIIPMGSEHKNFLFLGASLAFLVLAVGCSKPSEPAVEAGRPVRTLVVASGGETATRTFPGRVEASRQVELTFQVPGLLISLPAREGQEVAEDEVLAQLRPDEFQARLSAFQGQLDRARADLQSLLAGARPEERRRLEAELRSADASLFNARTELGRAQQLRRSQVISQLELDRAQTSYRVAVENREAARQTLDQGLIAREEDIMAKQSEVSGLEARVVEANLQLSDTTLRAPYQGVIAQRFVEQGQSIRAKQPVLKFQDVEEIEIAVEVPENVMAAVIRTSDILQLQASFSAAPGQQFPVHIKEVAQRADPVTQTFTIRVAMKSPEGVNLLPGMTATVAMTYRPAGILGGQIRVPLAAVDQSNSGESVVWVIGPDDLAARRAVTVGEVSGASISIANGLQPGDRIAVAGVTFLREGMKVRDLGDALGTSRP